MQYIAQQLDRNADQLFLWWTRMQIPDIKHSQVLYELENQLNKYADDKIVRTSIFQFACFMLFHTGIGTQESKIYEVQDFLRQLFTLEGARTHKKCLESTIS